MKNALLIGAIVFAVAVLVFSVYTLAATQNYFGADYKKAVNSELQDKCATPPGYTDAKWREHMGHHPDRYAECLK